MHRTLPPRRNAPLRLWVALALGSATAFAHAAPPDIAALLECRLDHADFVAYFPVLQDPLKAVALGWRPLPQASRRPSCRACTTPRRPCSRPYPCP